MPANSLSWSANELSRLSAASGVMDFVGPLSFVEHRDHFSNPQKTAAPVFDAATCSMRAIRKTTLLLPSVIFFHPH